MKFLILFVGFGALAGWTYAIYFKLKTVIGDMEAVTACVRALEAYEQTRRLRDAIPSPAQQAADRILSSPVKRDMHQTDPAE